MFGAIYLQALRVFFHMYYTINMTTSKTRTSTLLFSALIHYKHYGLFAMVILDILDTMLHTQVSETKVLFSRQFASASALPLPLLPHLPLFAFST